MASSVSSNGSKLDSCLHLTPPSPRDPPQAIPPTWPSDFDALRSHGSGLLLIERRQFLQDLYDTLPDKTRIRTSCNVLDIKQDEDGVEVILANGEVERGDLVVGCDGVYSFVRRILWEHANATSPGLITVEEKRGML